MKKIALKKPQPPTTKPIYDKENLYEVYLVKYRYYFKNKKEAEKFVCQTNDFLNSILHDLNFKLIEVYRMYRLAWFYFSDSSAGVNRMDLDRKINAEIDLIENSLHRLIFNTKGYSATDFVFTYINNSINGINSVCVMLLQIYKKRSEHANVYILENLQNGNNANKNKISDYLEMSLKINEKIKNSKK
jgi:hypothetical protein